MVLSMVLVEVEVALILLEVMRGLQVHPLLAVPAVPVHQLIFPELQHIMLAAVAVAVIDFLLAAAAVGGEVGEVLLVQDYPVQAEVTEEQVEQPVAPVAPAALILEVGVVVAVLIQDQDFLAVLVVLEL
jgi:hypothetical protein